uniref:Uncharacterized protein n=1 Tax=Chromera velia CCMP2878 TaxID=1169474 RepID=A0A0G4HQX0_9ALVE|eukprot:Cvel_7991.t1-p1 / transcript=Cvel_7991.t1 / gene=Cvel_7991 / organism=Chromera_velia_CCMP2878 / gene_product=hypothetical protein / transcript_product=hypothetical protein / location=Cvel_scaffold430:61162-63772(+) / protein_length=439 / sequence_SO=supercontig / SO=protein_coding / is_pseudo=false
MNKRDMQIHDKITSPPDHCSFWRVSGLKTNLKHQQRLGDSDDTLPAGEATLPPEFYRQEPACPFGRIFQRLPKDFKTWEEGMLKQYKDGWIRDKSPVGYETNDHNHDTKLGQGNTLGLVLGYLEMKPETKLSDQACTGLLGPLEAKRYPAIVRFSDFGADGETNLARMAVKVLFPNSWYGEINLLTTETLPIFPLADYNGVRYFTKQASGLSWLWQSLKAGGSLLWYLPRVLSASKNGDSLAKSYYSQLPYAAGEQLAMKFSFVSQQGGGKAGTAKSDRIEALKSSLSIKKAEFDFQVQLKANHQDPKVQQQANSAWKEAPDSVGTLVIPSQEVDTEGVSVLAREWLTGQLGLKEDAAKAVHKLLFFHPILTTHQHRPLGEVNAFRSDFYSHHAKARFETYLQPFADKAGSKVDFSYLLRKAEEAGQLDLLGGTDALQL